nr:hypothetical protein [Tanacetum cinerariifolium]
MNDIAFRELRKKLKIAQKEKDGIQLNVDKFENASKSLNKLIDCQIVNNCKKGLSYDNYNVVPPPYIGNFKPLKPDLSFTGLDEFVNKHVVENEANSSKKEPKVAKKNNDAPIIKEWVSNNEEEKVTQPRVIKKTVKPSVAKIKFVKAKHQEKTLGKLLNKLSILDKTPTNLETHPCAKKNIVSRAVLMKVGLVSVNTARQVNAAHPKTTMNTTRSMSYLSETKHSTVKRPIHKNTAFKNSNINQRVNTVRDKNFATGRPKAVVNAVKGNTLMLLRPQLVGFGNQRLKF